MGMGIGMGMGTGTGTGMGIMGGMPSLLDKMGAGVDFEELSIACNFFLLDKCYDSIKSKMMGRNC